MWSAQCGEVDLADCCGRKTCEQDRMSRLESNVVPAGPELLAVVKLRVDVDHRLRGDKLECSAGPLH